MLLKVPYFDLRCANVKRITIHLLILVLILNKNNYSIINKVKLIETLIILDNFESHISLICTDWYFILYEL